MYGGDESVRRTVDDMQVGHMWGGFFTVIADSILLELGPDGISVNRDFEPGEAWALYKKQMSDLKELLSTMPAVEAHVAEDVELLHAEGRVAAFIGCEGGHCLEGQIEHLEEMSDDGVLLLQLVHYAMNDIGDLQTLEPVYNGLSSFGRDVIREMDRLGMIIDVAHASFETVVNVAETSKNPMVLSHSQLKTDTKQHPRLIEPDHAKVIAETGGIIGMWPSGFGNDTMQDFVDNTMRLIDLIGIEHVGLGTDMDGNYKPVFDTYRQLPEWVAGLLEFGLSDEELARVVGGNALRVIKEVA
jgi:membrane dipeptidase